MSAVRHFLEEEVIGSTDGTLRFHARVAANVLRMVEREAKLGSLQEQRHRERLAELGYAEDRSLADAIRAGQLDQDYERVRDALRASVHDKVVVANPDHLRDETG